MWTLQISIWTVATRVDWLGRKAQTGITKSKFVIFVAISSSHWTLHYSLEVTPVFSVQCQVLLQHCFGDLWELKTWWCRVKSGWKETKLKILPTTNEGNK